MFSYRQLSVMLEEKTKACQSLKTALAEAEKRYRTLVNARIDLMQCRELFDDQVKIRTRELTAANKVLRKQIIKKRETEHRLLEREAVLARDNATLEQAVAALKVLLKRREAEKREFEQRVMFNIKELVRPFLDKLASQIDDERLKAYLSIVQTNLEDIGNSFSQRLALDFYRLTPSELRIATYIGRGQKTQEIADMLGLSRRTIEAYRRNIRKKLGLDNKRVNLRTFLLSIVQAEDRL